VSSDTVSTPADAFTTIPVVDLSAWHGSAEDRNALADEVRAICHDVGFFHLVGHGVPERFSGAYFDGLQRFFALPEATKARIDKAHSRHFRGWERVGAELTNNRPDHREQLDVSTEHPARPADVEPPYLRLDGPNQWLPDEVLPGFRPLLVEFFERLGTVADELMAVLAVGLGLEPGHFHGLFGERPLSFAKLIHYPATPAGEAGVNAHHDAGFLTILLQHGVRGLQALNPRGDWIDVDPQPGAFVVNLGEMLQEMTGNYFVATTHRVITEQHRFSSGYFHGPDLRTRLDRLPLTPEFAAAVVASERHATAGFMAKRHELMAGRDGIASTPARVYGEQLWNYYVRSYPDNVRRHYPDRAEASTSV
jgi:isopenicillin N synthase-like dioxygenase